MLSFLIKLGILLGIIGGILLFLGPVYGVYYKNIFPVKKIEVKGCKEISCESIKALIHLKGGENLFKLPEEAIRARILSAFPLKNVIVIKNLPDTIRVFVEERVPLAITKIKGKYYFVDKEGKIVREATKEDLARYPLVRLDGLGKSKKRLLLSFLHWIKTHNKYLPVFENIKSVEIGEDRIVLITRRDVKIYFPLKDLDSLCYFYRELDHVMTYLYTQDIFEKVSLIRMDYPEGEALIKFKKE